MRSTKIYICPSDYIYFNIFSSNPEYVEKTLTHQTH